MERTFNTLMMVFSAVGLALKVTGQPYKIMCHRKGWGFLASVHSLQGFVRYIARRIPKLDFRAPQLTTSESTSLDGTLEHRARLLSTADGSYVDLSYSQRRGEHWLHMTLRRYGDAESTWFHAHWDEESN